MREPEMHAQVYEAIRARFDSKRTCGPDKDEPWWDWLAVYLKDKFGDLERELVQANAVLDWTRAALEGEPVSDFAESFAVVRLAVEARK